MELIVVIDTNAYSDWRRNGRWHEWLAIADRVVMPIIVYGELLHGFRRGDRMRENELRLHEFLTEPQVKLMPATRRTAELYAELLTRLQQQGTPVPTNDIWIAAITQECGGKLLSRDEHFAHFPQLLRVKV